MGKKLKKFQKTMLMIKYIFKFNTYNALLRLCLQQIDGVYYRKYHSI